MTKLYLRGCAANVRLCLIVAGLLSGWLLAGVAQAQAPAWALAATSGIPQPGGSSRAFTVVADASGNLLVTGDFYGSVTFGSTTLTSAGSGDMFLAKYVPSTNTWAWAVRGGGTGSELGQGIAVSGTSVYLTGIMQNNAANTNRFTFGGAAGSTGTATQVGASTGTVSYDIVLAKYTDNGTSATFGWSQVAGGTGTDTGYRLAASGNNVYLVGTLINSTTNANAVVFGGSGTTAGTVPQYGTSSTGTFSDIVLAKYVDNGASATVAWVQVAGGAGTDLGTGIALSGNSVYLTGTLENSTTNPNAVVFGGAGTTPGTVPQYGATPTKSADIVLAKYTDNGPSATVAWVQVSGGTGYDQGVTIALNGASVYVVGQLTNSATNANAAVFGGSGTTPGTVPQAGASPSSSSDIVLAKYTDNGPTATLNWTQVGGGTSDDNGYSVAVSGNSLYITGFYTNNAANANAVLLGGTGTTVGTVSVPGVSSTTAADIIVAKYVDNGSSAALAWTQTAGGAGYDYGNELVISGSRLYVVGQVLPAATFGSLTIGAPVGTTTNFVAALDLPAALATAPAAASASLSLYPNPTPGPATLSGATPGTPVGIFDALGRRVATATADATGAAPLPAGLAPGLYLVRAGTSTVRWVVE